MSMPRLHPSPPRTPEQVDALVSANVKQTRKSQRGLVKASRKQTKKQMRGYHAQA